MLGRLKCPSQARCGTVVGLGQVVWRSAVAVEVKTGLPIQILSQLQLHGSIEVETYASRIGQAGVNASIGENIRRFEAEKIHLGAHYRLGALAGAANRRHRGVLLAVPIRADKRSRTARSITSTRMNASSVRNGWLPRIINPVSAAEATSPIFAMISR